jgi:CHAD domain-containing protein
VECRAIVHALRAPLALHTRVHEARKAIRRARALLALAKDGDAAFDIAPADAILQRIGDGLSRLRDAHAAMETARTLATQQGRKHWRPVIEALRERANALAARELVRDPGFERRQSIVQGAQHYLELQPWGKLKSAQIRAGLQRQRRRVERAARRAKKTPDPDHLHCWRRRARRLRMQVEALPRLKPQWSQATPATPRSKSLHKLTDALGWQQDLHVLSALLRRLSGIAERKALQARLRALLEKASAAP